MNENQAVELGRHTPLWVGPRHHHAAVEKSPGRSELQAPRLRKNLQRSRERDMSFLVTLPCAVSPEGEAATAPARPGWDHERRPLASSVPASSRGGAAA